VILLLAEGPLAAVAALVTTSSFFLPFPSLSSFCDLLAISLGDFLVAIMYVYRCGFVFCAREDPVALEIFRVLVGVLRGEKPREVPLLFYYYQVCILITVWPKLDLYCMCS
jgi:hypothetical protein